MAPESSPPLPPPLSPSLVRRSLQVLPSWWRHATSACRVSHLFFLHLLYGCGCGVFASAAPARVLRRLTSTLSPSHATCICRFLSNPSLRFRARFHNVLSATSCEVLRLMLTPSASSRARFACGRKIHNVQSQHTGQGRGICSMLRRVQQSWLGFRDESAGQLGIERVSCTAVGRRPSAVGNQN